MNSRKSRESIQPIHWVGFIDRVDFSTKLASRATSLMGGKSLIGYKVNLLRVAARPFGVQNSLKSSAWGAMRADGDSFAAQPSSSRTGVASGETGKACRRAPARRSSERRGGRGPMAIVEKPRRWWGAVV